MLASAEVRRNNALHEIDRHRAALGGAVRQSIEEVEDAEFRDVEPGEVTARGQLWSDRRRRANQADARASTGPKTRAGSERAGGTV
jgi:hypothetical protein